MKSTVRLAGVAVLCVAAVTTMTLAKEGAGRKAGAGAGKAREALADRAGNRADAGKDKKDLSDKASSRTEARQERQANRIEEGIKKGYLTPDEISKLETQQKSIEDLQKFFNSDGKITKDEAKQLRQQLDEASRCIFAEKHDAEGNTKSVMRLGKNVTLKNDVAQKLEDPNLSKQDARAFLKDFHKMMDLKKTLSTGNISDGDRTTMQNEYNTLLNKYFDSK